MSCSCFDCASLRPFLENGSVLSYVLRVNKGQWTHVRQKLESAGWLSYHHHHGGGGPLQGDGRMARGTLQAQSNDLNGKNHAVTITKMTGGNIAAIRKSEQCRQSLASLTARLPADIIQ
eukprot:TRINITY_DN15688_c1_g1_i1.p1 TRINITY_DN15688_c1_g1~~TRINITY_DN15688_c1_g1_i1.p1  ORF type:complete len:138 (+),score=2.28 TRINITY_DN15688_c1_g1_i1:59-415(+)